jgi:hypothetical protein
MDAIAITGCRSSLDRHEGHRVCPFPQDITVVARFAQDLSRICEAVGNNYVKPLLTEIGGMAFQYFPEAPSKSYDPF